ncbi:MAG: hypothetical protein ACRDTG_06040 [Pseudonocardiaceae bacterium]
MTRLNQIIAVEKGTKNTSYAQVTALHHDAQKTAPLAGISRVYRPRDEEGEQLPPEAVRVQIKADDLIGRLTTTLTRLFDVTATKDWANREATADVVVDGEVLVVDAPVTWLLFLEKQLTDLHTFVTKLPTLDPSEQWVEEITSTLTPASVDQISPRRGELLNALPARLGCDQPRLQRTQRPRGAPPSTGRAPRNAAACPRRRECLRSRSSWTSGRRRHSA